MKLDLLRLDHVYHLGVLAKPAKRRRSHEGHGLSVSRCPDAWARIARLGGSPLHELSLEDALFLDFLALGLKARKAILDWAIAQGLLAMATRWRAWDWNEDTESWHYALFKTEANAIDEADCAHNFRNDPDWTPAKGVQELAGMMRRTLPGEVTSLVERVEIPLLTRTGDARAGDYGRDVDGTDMAAMFWIEDVARAALPQLVGIWWAEAYEPDSLSAPRGAILPCCLDRFSVRKLGRATPDDNEDIRPGCRVTYNF